MPILSTKPVTVEGVTYERLAVSLAISPAWKETDLGPSLAIRFQPYTKDTQGNVLKLEDQAPADGEAPVSYSSSLAYSSLAMPDSDVEAKVSELMTVVQGLVNLKGL